MESNRTKFIEYLVKKRGSIIPIIGEKCFVAKEKNGVEVSLQEYIVEKFLPESPRKDDLIGKGYYGMGQLLHDLDIKRTKLSEFKDKLKDRVTNGNIKLRENIKAFLGTGKFEVVVTTVPFKLLEKEFPRLYKNVVCFVPSDCHGEGRNETDALKPGSLYKIFGDIEGPCVLTEKDLLHYLHQLNNPNSEQGNGAVPLVRYIGNKNNSLLMPIGCDDLPNWIFRFLWYPLSNPLQEDYVGGIWYENVGGEDFKQYLNDYNFKIFDNQSISNEDSIFFDFANEMAKGVKEHALAMEVAWSYSGWDYFISYKKEDADLANAIYEILKGKGKEVWLDNRNINVGDKYWKAIQYGIENSERCIFVITNKYIQQANRRKNEDGSISGVFHEIELINKYGNKDVPRYAIPLIKKNEKVLIEGNLKALTVNLLADLYDKPGYEVLRTEELFKDTENREIDFASREDLEKLLDEFKL